MSLREKVSELISTLNGLVFGQNELVESMVAGLVCHGHILLEGPPGVGKTLTVKSLSQLIDAGFKRIQFTPDLLPSDLIGSMIYNPEKGTFTTKYGPIFTQILLADEINRAPAKVQSALLEAMEERQVTIGDTTHKISDPFIVLATQNPIENEGTFKLPEAQLDRFMMKVEVGYPSFEEELKVLEVKGTEYLEKEAIVTPDELEEIAQELENLYVDEKLKKIIVNVIQATRPESKLFHTKFKGAILVGASPRSGKWLLKAARFYAYLDQMDYVTPDHILRSIENVLGHRVILSFEARADHLSGRSVVKKILEETL